MFHMTLKKIILEPAIAWKLVTCQRITLTNTDMTLMGQHLSPRYGQVILVSGYPASTAVNWSQRWCPKCVHYQFSCAPKLARKYEIKHWCPVVRTDGRCTVTWLQNFLGWVDYVSYGAPPTRALRARGAPLSEMVQKVNNWPRKEALRANVKYWGLSLNQGSRSSKQPASQGLSIL